MNALMSTSYASRWKGVISVGTMAGSEIFVASFFQFEKSLSKKRRSHAISGLKSFLFGAVLA